jgi:hypothetical protein
MANGELDGTAVSNSFGPSANSIGNRPRRWSTCTTLGNPTIHNIMGLAPSHTNGWSDIAAHFDRARRKGLEWPAMEQVAGKRGRLNSSRAFMFEIIGDFDIGKDRSTGPQSDTVVLVIATLMSHDLGNIALKFHNETTTPKCCPASAVRKQDILDRLLPYSHMSESDAVPLSDARHKEIFTAAGKDAPQHDGVRR